MTSNNSDIIDLTSSFNLVDHYSLNNVFIDLDTDESFCQDQTNHEKTAESERPRNPPRKRRRSTKSRTTNPTAPLSLVSEVKSMKNLVKKNKIIHKRLPEEPPEKKSKGFGCCPICLEDFGTKPLSSTKCGHVFCSECIKLALKNSAICPQCRMRLRGGTAVHPIFLPGN